MKEQFIAVIKEHKNLIYKICYSYCNNPENRKDLQQEILIQIWHSLKKFDGRVKMSTWLYRIAFNTAISYYRSDKKYSNSNESIDSCVISLSTEDDISEQDDKITMLYEFIEELKEFDKALVLLYLDDNKYKDIGDILGISETNVATKLNRIKKILSDKFKILKN